MIDTSCMVAVLCTWHEHHERATREIEGRLDRGEEVLVAAHGLVESYAVLTRLPPPHRLSPIDARDLLLANFSEDSAVVVSLSTEVYIRLLQNAPERGIAGGTVYDAVILMCGLSAGVNVLLTFNDRQFRQLAVRGIEIVVPA